MKKNKGRLRQQWFVIKELTTREIKRRYSRSYLGIVWSVLNPLLTMLVISLIFTQIFRRSIENFPVYFLTGNIIWTLFTTATRGGMTTIVDNKNMLIRVKYPMEVFILARVWTAVVNFGYSFVAYIAIFFAFKTQLNIYVLYLPVIIFLVTLFSLGISQILSVAYIFFGDVKHLYSVLLTLWMYCSAIFYPADKLEGVIRRVIDANPMFAYINCARKVVMWGEFPSIADNLQMILWAFASYMLGRYILKKNRTKIMVHL